MPLPKIAYDGVPIGPPLLTECPVVVSVNVKFKGPAEAIKPKIVVPKTLWFESVPLADGKVNVSVWDDSKPRKVALKNPEFGADKLEFSTPKTIAGSDGLFGLKPDIVTPVPPENVSAA